MKQNYSRKLAGLRIGLSVSPSNDEEGLGFDSHETNRATREISLAVLSQGGRLAFGHDWRPEGVMASLFSFALEYQRSDSEQAEAGAMIANFVPWPSKTSVSRDARRRFEDIIEIHEMRPPEVSPSMTRTPALRVASLTHMRKELVSTADARIAIGGRTSGSGGRTSGVVEEVFLTLQAEKPVYLSGLFGGATQQVIDVILGQRDGDLSAFRARPDVAEALGPSLLSGGYGINPAEFENYPLDQIAENNGLSAQENRQLFEATDLNAVVGHMLTGLGRLKDQGRSAAKAAKTPNQNYS